MDDVSSFFDVTSSPVNEKGSLSSADSEPSLVGATGFEPVTPSVSSWGPPQLSDHLTVDEKHFTTVGSSPEASACTPACCEASGSEAPVLSVEDLAKAINSLTPDDRMHLVALILAGQRNEQTPR